MSNTWLESLTVDPTSVLLSSGNEAREYFTKRDILERMTEPINYVWQLPEVQKMLLRQQPDGSWKDSGKETVSFPKYHYSLEQTWKNFRILTE